MAGRFSPQQVSTGPDKSPLKTIILGGPGVGKTWLVSTITGDDGSPIFFQSVEEGAKGLCPDARPAGFRDARGTWLAPRSFAELLDALDTFLHEVNAPVEVQTPAGPVKRRPYRHFGIDSLSGIERLVHEAACQAEGVQHMEGADYQRVWNGAVSFWLKVREKLDEIRRSGVHVWVIAHATDAFHASETTGETFRKADLLLAGKSQMLDQVRNLWRSWADNVWYVTHDVQVISKKGRRTIANLRGRIVVTRETGGVCAKSRLSMPASLPATWRDLQQAITGRTPDRSERVRKDIAAIAAELEPAERAEIDRDLAAAKTTTQLASVLQRAQGMRAMLEEDDDAAPVPATSAEPVDEDPASPRRAVATPKPAATNGAAAH